MSSLNMTRPSDATMKRVEEIGFIFEDYAQRVIIAAILALAFVVGILGNALVILVVTLSRRLRSSTNWFVVNLAATDFITCLLLPFQMVALLNLQRWPLPDWICDVSGGMGFVCVTSSTTSLALIAFNRWYLLTKPRSVYMSMFTWKRMTALVISTWLYSTLVVVVPSVAGVGTPGYSYKFKTCTYYDGDGYKSTTFYGVVLGVGMFVLPTIPIITFYILIYSFVRRHTRKMVSQMRMTPSRSDGTNRVLRLPSSGDRPSTAENSYFTSDSVQNDTTSEQERAPAERSAKGLNRHHVTFTKKMALIVCVFFACYLPGIALIAMPIDSLFPAIPWAQLLVVINSSLNPIIYAWAIPSFREVMGCIMRCKYKTIPEPVRFTWHF